MIKTKIFFVISFVLFGFNVQANLYDQCVDRAVARGGSVIYLTLNLERCFETHFREGNVTFKQCVTTSNEISPSTRSGSWRRDEFLRRKCYGGYKDNMGVLQCQSIVIHMSRESGQDRMINECIDSFKAQMNIHQCLRLSRMANFTSNRLRLEGKCRIADRHGLLGNHFNNPLSSNHGRGGANENPNFGFHGGSSVHHHQ